MTRRAWRWSCGAAGATMAVVAVTHAASRVQDRAADQTPQFRTATDVVTLAVGVRDGRRFVPDLTAADFVVLDNGVRQRVERLDATRVPVDVSLLIDVSGGEPEFWGRPRSHAEVTRRVTELVTRARDAFQPADRLRVVTIDTAATEIVPLQAVEAPVRIAAETFTSNGPPALYDAIASALLRGVDVGRRHLVIVLTKADDNMSVIDGAVLTTLARRSDATLHVVYGDSQVGNTKCYFDCGFPTHRFWRPFRRDGLAALPTIAQNTGGTFREYNAFGLPLSFDKEVQNTLAEVRQGYVLQYVATGVKREGWHTLDVKIAGHPSFAVSARAGYGIDRPADADAAARATGADDPGIAALMADFDRGTAMSMPGPTGTRELARVLTRVREGDALWPAQPRREAVFALELASIGLRHDSQIVQGEATRLLQQQERLMRQPFGPDEFECTWYWTLVANVVGLAKPDIAQPFIQQAIARCPSEPRFPLALAVTTDQRWMGTTVGYVGPRPPQPPPAQHVRDLLQRYDAVRNTTPAGIEATVREAWFLYRTGQLARAQALIDEAPSAIDNRELRYLRDFVRGQILRAEGQHAAAAASFVSALEAWPGAQSPRIALLALAIQDGRRDAASAYADAIETADTVDPWWFYWQGDFRVYQTLLGRLRAMAR